DDALRIRRGFGCAGFVVHRHGGCLTLALDLDAELHRTGGLARRAEAEQLAEEALFLLFRVWRHVAHEVGAGAAVAVFHGEAGAVQRQADTAPGAVEAFADLHHRLAADVRHARGLRDRRAGHHGLGLLLRDAELDHQAAQEFGLQRRV